MDFKSLDKKKVLLGLSGGVDSTAAALLLKEDGYSVSGLFFDVHNVKSNNAELAENTAKELGIDYIYRNVNSEFSQTVIKNFCEEYAQGRTPNPCVLCNPNVKFKTLIEEANKIGAYYIATGHYARIFYNEENEKYFIRQAENVKKDQSYMLYGLGQEVLSRLIFPLNRIEDKEATRDIVRTENINNAERKDSQEICFIPEDENYMDYIVKNGYKPIEGNFVDSKGVILGSHKGLASYTIGQRKGLGITFGRPMFVTKINHNNNTVTLGPQEELLEKKVVSKDNVFVFSSYDDLKTYEGVKIQAKIRYASKPAPAKILFLKDGTVETYFDEVQRAVTPGQSIVFYKDNLVIGGGIII